MASPPLEFELVRLSRSDVGGVSVIVLSGTRFSAPFLLLLLLLLLDVLPLMFVLLPLPLVAEASVDEDDDDDAVVAEVVPFVGRDLSGLAGSR